MSQIEPIRADRIFKPGNLSQQMYEHIIQTDMSIAILTGGNPNVYYELAIAQCAPRPVVAFIREGEAPLFDVKDLRRIEYSLEVHKVDSAKNELRSMIQTLEQSNWHEPNPFAPFGWYDPDRNPELQRMIETARPAPLAPKIHARYRIPGLQSSMLILRSGNVRGIKDVSVVVSSENTDMQLARYYDPSISGMLRYLDSEKSGGGDVWRDTLGENLSEVMRQVEAHPPVRPGVVFPTPTNGLRRQGIQYVFHVAAVRGEIGAGYRLVIDELETCIRNCYKKFDELASQCNPVLTSILFPLLGAGSARMDPVDSAKRILPVIAQEMEQFPRRMETHLLAWVGSHVEAIRRAAQDLGLEKVA